MGGIRVDPGALDDADAAMGRSQSRLADMAGQRAPSAAELLQALRRRPAVPDLGGSSVVYTPPERPNPLVRALATASTPAPWERRVTAALMRLLRRDGA